MEGRLSDVEDSLKGLTRVLLHGIAELPPPREPTPRQPKLNDPQDTATWADIGAELDSTMDSFCSHMGVNRNGEPELPAYLAPTEDEVEELPVVGNFTLDSGKLTGLKKLRAMRTSNEGPVSPPRLQQGVVRRAMRRYDVNRDGSIDEAELSTLLNDVVSDQWNPTSIDTEGSEEAHKSATVDSGMIGTIGTLQSLHNMYETYDRMAQ